MSRERVPGDGPKCLRCGRPAVWSGWCQMEDGKGYCPELHLPEERRKVTIIVRGGVAYLESAPDDVEVEIIDTDVDAVEFNEPEEYMYGFNPQL